MGGSKSSKQPSSTTQTQVPWGPQGQHLGGSSGTPIYESFANPNYRPGGLDGGGFGGPRTINRIVGYEGGKPGIFNEAERIYQDRVANQFQGPIAADINDTQRSVADMLNQRAQNGNPLLGQAQGQLSDTLAGNYMDFDTFNQGFGNDIRDSINSQFALSGRTGSGHHVENITEGLTDSFVRNVYEPERQRQMAAAGLAPTLQAADYQELGSALGASSATRDLEQQQLDIDRANTDFPLDQQQAALNDYSAIVQGGNYGGTTTTNSPLYRNSSAGLLGGAATGAGLASTLGATGPLGLGIGALGGAFLGK